MRRGMRLWIAPAEEKNLHRTEIDKISGLLPIKLALQIFVAIYSIRRVPSVAVI
jgi:hypothetical protein